MTSPDRTGSGISRATLRKFLRIFHSRNPGRLDTHYFIPDLTLTQDSLLLLNPYQNTALPPVPIAATEFLACEDGTLECFNMLTDDDVPSLDVDFRINDVVQTTQSISPVGGTVLTIPLNIPYTAGSRLSVGFTLRSATQTELIIQATLLRRIDYVGV